MSKRPMLAVGVLILSAGLLFATATGAAAARPDTAHGKKPPAVSFMRFHLDTHVVVVGDPVTGTARLLSRSGKTWMPVEGAALSVRLDGTEVGTVTTDADGRAAVSITTDTAGDHVAKVFYAGDDSHKAAHRAQGFEAVPAS